MMAWHKYTSTITTSNSAPELFFILKHGLKQIGWTVVDSGNGAAYSAGDIINAFADLTGTSGWYQMLSPDGRAAFTVQINPAINTQPRIKYCFDTTFTVGASPTQTPATAVAADTWLAWGGGTDAAPIYGTNITVVVGDGVYVRGMTSAPYNCTAFSMPGIGNPHLCFVYDMLKTGTYDPVLEQRPQRILIKGHWTAATGFGYGVSGNNTGPVGWRQYPSSPALVGQGGGSPVVYAAGTIKEGIDVNFYSSRMALLPFAMYSGGTPYQFAGCSSVLAYVGTSGAVATNGMRLTGPDGQLFLRLNSFAIPWDGVAITPDPSAGATGTVEYISVLPSDPAGGSLGPPTGSAGGTPGCLVSVDDTGCFKEVSATAVESCG